MLIEFEIDFNLSLNGAKKEELNILIFGIFSLSYDDLFDKVRI